MPSDPTQFRPLQAEEMARAFNEQRAKCAMNARDFQRIALRLEGVERGSHMGAVDFRVGGRIFATLASQKAGYGNLIIGPELQAELISQRPDLFLPVAGGWGRMGATHIRLAEAAEPDLERALRAAWRYRVEKNSKTRARKRPAKPRRLAR